MQILNAEPLTLTAVVCRTSPLEAQRDLARGMIYGYLPEVIGHPANARNYLQDFAENLFLNGILTRAETRKPADLKRLIPYLAQHVGKEFRFWTAARELGISSPTVERYTGILEDCNLIKIVPSYCMNPVTEIAKGRRIYFTDNGLRNAFLTEGLEPLPVRYDREELWSNLVVSERIKRNEMLGKEAKIFYWRSRQNQEMEFVEREKDFVSAFYCSYDIKTKKKPSRAFQNAYPTCSVTLLTPLNFADFILSPSAG
jgi:hypothetical protein